MRCSDFLTVPQIWGIFHFQERELGNCSQWWSFTQCEVCIPFECCALDDGEGEISACLLVAVQAI